MYNRIFPARIRAPGVAIGVGSQWLFNFVFSLTTPYMMSSMGWGTFMLWGVFDVAIAAISFLYLKETRGLSLEAIANQRFKKGSSNDDLRAGAVRRKHVEGNVELHEHFEGSNSTATDI